MRKVYDLYQDLRFHPQFFILSLGGYRSFGCHTRKTSFTMYTQKDISNVFESKDPHAHQQIVHSYHLGWAHSIALYFEELSATRTRPEKIRQAKKR